MCIITFFFVLFQNFFLPVGIYPGRVWTGEIYRKSYLGRGGKVHKINVFDNGEASRCEAALEGTMAVIAIKMQEDIA